MARRWLKLDIDRARRPPKLSFLLARLARAGRSLVAVGERRSPGGRGWHMWLLVRPMPRTAMETVALQAVLGSDGNREAYLIRRAHKVDAGLVPKFWQARFNVLYDRRGER